MSEYILIFMLLNADGVPVDVERMGGFQTTKDCNLTGQAIAEGLTHDNNTWEEYQKPLHRAGWTAEVPGVFQMRWTCATNSNGTPFHHLSLIPLGTRLQLGDPFPVLPFRFFRLPIFRVDL